MRLEKQYDLEREREEIKTGLKRPNWHGYYPEL